MVDVPTADIRRERIALPLLRDERLELQVRELTRIVAERSGQAVDTNAESGQSPASTCCRPRSRRCRSGSGSTTSRSRRPKEPAEAATPPARTADRGT